MSPKAVWVSAALANNDIRSYLDAPRYAGIWTVEGVNRHPTVRVVFEHAEVIGGSGESLAAARHKNFGPFLGIEPVRPEDPVHPCRILFVYKATSPYNRRVEQRRHLKRLLGRQYRTLVTKAARSTKQDFLKYDLTPDGARAIHTTAQARPRPVLAGRRGPGVPRPAGPTPPTPPLRYRKSARPGRGIGPRRRAMNIL